jgi:saccharopine dehydrogenase (NAD+, L-lysine-forming)
MLQTDSHSLSVVVDVSCDFTNPNNPFPIYKEGTTFFKPTVRILDGERPIDVVSIDHLPSLVPWESSKEFADALIDHLVVCDNSEIWGRVRKLFEVKSALVQ